MSIQADQLPTTCLEDRTGAPKNGPRDKRIILIQGRLTLLETFCICSPMTQPLRISTIR